MEHWLYLLVAISCLTASSAQFHDVFQHLNQQSRDQQAWTDLERQMSHWVQSQLHGNESTAAGQVPPRRISLLYGIFKLLRGSAVSSVPTAFDKNVSSECYSASRRYLHAIENLEVWALKMQESSGKLPDGFVDGFLSGQAMGLYDECLSVRAHVSEAPFQGRYCTVYFATEHVNESDVSAKSPDRHQLGDNWITLLDFLQTLLSGERIAPKEADGHFGLISLARGMGICIPSVCSAADVRQAIAQLVGSFPLPGEKGKRSSIVTITDERYCYSDDDPVPSFDGPDIVVIVVLSVIGLLVVAATIHEYVRKYLNQPVDPKSDGIAVRALHCFSALNNSRKLLATTKSSENFGCVNGIRVISTTWVVMGHSYYVLVLASYSNISGAAKDLHNWSFQTIANGTVSVDSFFVLSGMLVACGLLRELDRSKGRLNIPLFYIHRYLRLTPVYAVILAFLATLVVYLGSGPNWQDIHYSMTEACRNEWWRNLLYINIYFDSQLGGCMGETWYLTNDMLLYLLSPLFVYPLWRWKKRGVIWVVFAVLALLSAGVAVWTVYEFPLGMPSRPFDPPGTGDFSHLYYVSPAMRSPPYLLGILLGYLLHVTKNKPVKIPKMLVAFLWAASTAVALAVVYGLVPFLREDKVPHVDDLTRVAYGSLNHFAWALSLSWVIFACIKGYGGIVEDCSDGPRS